MKKCSVCGREVAETVHFLDGYKVDYYVKHCVSISKVSESYSPTEQVREKGPNLPMPTTELREKERIRGIKLGEAFDVIECVECYGKNKLTIEKD